MKVLKFLFMFLLLPLISSDFGFIVGQQTPSVKLTTPRSLPPKDFPLPPFLKSDHGRFHIVSTEYYSQDAKPFLYKRLVKFDTKTGEAWVLRSRIVNNKEVRSWEALITE